MMSARLSMLKQSTTLKLLSRFSRIFLNKKMSSMFLLLFLLLSLVPISSTAHPGERQAWLQRSQARETKRWTLQEWLEQKERNQLMDIWLAMNSPSPYELSLQIESFSYRLNDAQEYQVLRGGASAFAKIFGIHLEYENNHNQAYSGLSGSLQLRLLGNSIQNSHLFIGFGQRTLQWETPGSRLLQQFGEVGLTLHLNKYFGFLGEYQSFLPTQGLNQEEVTGSRTKSGIFLDFGILRLFGNWSQEITGTQTRSQRTGIESGLQIFF